MFFFSVSKIPTILDSDCNEFYSSNCPHVNLFLRSICLPSTVSVHCSNDNPKLGKQNILYYRWTTWNQCILLILISIKPRVKGSHDAQHTGTCLPVLSTKAMMQLTEPSTLTQVFLFRDMSLHFAIRLSWPKPSHSQEKREIQSHDRDCFLSLTHDYTHLLIDRWHLWKFYTEISLSAQMYSLSLGILSLLKCKFHFNFKYWLP